MGARGIAIVGRVTKHTTQAACTFVYRKLALPAGKIAIAVARALGAAATLWSALWQASISSGRAASQVAGVVFSTIWNLITGGGAGEQSESFCVTPSTFQAAA